MGLSLEKVTLADLGQAKTTRGGQGKHHHHRFGADNADDIQARVKQIRIQIEEAPATTTAKSPSAWPRWPAAWP